MIDRLFRNLRFSNAVFFNSCSANAQAGSQKMLPILVAAVFLAGVPPIFTWNLVTE